MKKRSIDEPPFFTRMGCSLLISVLTLSLFALFIAAMLLWKTIFGDIVTKDNVSIIDTTFKYLVYFGPEVVILFSIIAFYECVDFLVWFKQPLYHPVPPPPPDPEALFKPKKD
jgi:hypothetical protein